MHWLMRLFVGQLQNGRSTRRLVRPLRLEECESRVVPAVVNYSTNWAGYAITSTPDSVSAVSGSWTVPTVTGSGAGYSSTWVGIDGYSSNSVEQIGVEADLSQGVPNYSAWYEMYPSAMVTVDLAIHAKDQISASVTYDSGHFTLTITDANDPVGSNTFTITQAGAHFARSSAEWIEEAPSSESSTLPLANFGSVTFTKAQATINGVTGGVGSTAWSSKLEEINMANGNVQEATTSPISADGSSFTVTYGSVSNPPPPLTPPPTIASSPPTTTSPPPTPTPQPVGASPLPSPPASPPSSPVTAPVLTQPTPGIVLTTTRLSARAGTNPRVASATLTALVSSTVPVGTLVELFEDGRAMAFAQVEDVNGLNEATFTVTFSRVGTYAFTTEFLGAGGVQASTSTTETIVVTHPAQGRWVVSVSEEIDTPMKKVVKPALVKTT